MSALKSALKAHSLSLSLSFSLPPVIPRSLSGHPRESGDPALSFLASFLLQKSWVLRIRGGRRQW